MVYRTVTLWRLQWSCTSYIHTWLIMHKAVLYDHASERAGTLHNFPTQYPIIRSKTRHIYHLYSCHTTDRTRSPTKGMVGHLYKSPNSPNLKLMEYQGGTTLQVLATQPLQLTAPVYAVPAMSNRQDHPRILATKGNAWGRTRPGPSYHIMTYSTTVQCIQYESSCP